MADWNTFLSQLQTSDVAGTNPFLQAGENIAAGFALAGPVGGAAAALQEGFKNAIGQIGKGRKEADLVVPVQNQVGNLLIQINNGMKDASLSVQQLQGMEVAVAQAYQAFEKFTHSPQFTDGRASRQARDTIRPLVDGKDETGNVVRTDGGTLGNLQKMIAARGGTDAEQVAGLLPFQTAAGTGQPQGSTSTAVWLAGGAIVAKLAGLF